MRSIPVRPSLRLAAAAAWLCWATLGLVPAARAEVVDLNTADAATLSRALLGIGETRARAIVEHRRRHGPFGSVDELALVRGIGAKTVERNRDRLRVSGAAVAGGAAVPRPPGAAAPRRAAGAVRASPASPRRGVPPDEVPPEIIVAY